MTLVLETDPVTALALQKTMGPAVQPVNGLPGLARLLSDDPLQDLVVIGPDFDLASALLFTEAQRVERSSLGVILVRSGVDANLLAAALRAGVREVVEAGNLPGLHEACERSAELSRRVRVGTGEDHLPTELCNGRMITVFSAKGGCGKTTVATNLAAALATSGVGRVCLLDLDLAFGDVAIALQLFPTRTIADAVGLQNSLDETAVRSLVTVHGSGLEVVAAPLEPGAVERIPASLVSDLLGVLKSMYAFVVVDTPPAFTDHVLAAFDQSDEFVLLTTLDVPALKNLKLTMETLSMLDYPRERWRIVLNRSDAKVGLVLDDVQKAINAPISLEIPSSRAVPASINRGVPIVLDAPSHPVSAAIRRMAVSQLPVGATAPRDRRGFTLRRRGGSA